MITSAARTMAFLASAVALGSAPSSADAATDARGGIDDGGIARTDQQTSGDRVAAGHGPLDGALDVDLGGVPAWVLPSPADPSGTWLVALEDGTIVGVTTDASGDAETRPAGRLPPGAPPKAVLDEQGRVVVSDAREDALAHEDAIPDARLVTASDGTDAVLAGPTESYPHGVLGDAIEASSVHLIHPSGRSVTIEIATHEVIEGLSPIFSDLDADGTDEIIITVSDADGGARLRVHALDGSTVAESDPIGQGFRWRHQIAAGPIGPDDETELVAVRTPHIGGVVEAFRIDGDRLVLVAAEPGYRSHALGSPNLDMGLFADVDGDGRLDVVVPTQEMRSLVALSRVGDGFERVEVLPLDGMLATNIAASADPDGRLSLAVGTVDGRLRIFR